MDYRLYHAINEFVLDHDWLGRFLVGLENWAVPLLAVATFGLWLLARPGGDRKWKLASASALAAAALALIINQVIGQLWHRERPFASHPSAHVWGSRSHDPSFPSDHASAAYAIAFAVFLFDRVAGSTFLLAATLIGVGRVFIGAHYPADVLAGVLVGLGAALLVVRAGMPLLDRLVHLVERVTDPSVARFWRWSHRSAALRR
ncbi:MAG: phosphatase PAP2 family protein [Thermoleophilia bacterium]|nr:phosphatase PAP2 family protein [Thermoleophilia bacterium]MDH5281969.1 phosphatase PAP2 family protein [Thermoleophilia bacterium]